MSFSSPGKIWWLFTPRERRRALAMLCLIILMALAETAGVLSIVPFLTVLSQPSAIETNTLLARIYSRVGFASTRDFIVALGFVSMTLVVASSLFKTVTLHVLNRFAHLLRHEISARLLSRYLHQPYEFFLDRNPSVLAKNVLAEVDQLMFGSIQPLSQLIAQGAVVLAMGVLIFAYDPLTAVGIVIVLGLLYGSIYTLARKYLARTGRDGVAANASRYKACNEALGGIKEIKVSDASRAYLDTFARASREWSRHMANSETLAQSPLYLVEATGYTLLIAIALLLLGRSGEVGQVLPALGLYGFAAYRMLPSAQIMYRSFAKLRFSSASLDAVHGDLSLSEPEPSPTRAPLVPKECIRLSNVDYAYAAKPDAPVLRNFNLEIPAGTSVGIIGPSGAGKSTVMDLLLGLLQPQAGTLSVDGITIDESNVAAWQRSIGYVPQHIYLADTSIAENIAFGLHGEEIDMQAVERAARAAQIHDFIVHELPEGYDTPIGDRGIRLSGGQRQRVGIARALYRDPPVLFFDEATSALDAQTEEALNGAIRNLSGEKTIIIIAHRPASLASCATTMSIGESHASTTSASIQPI